MLPVYDVLCLALLGMALSSLCFTQVLSTMLLRKRFVQRPRLAPLQWKITRGLQLALIVCVLAWLSTFLWGASAVGSALMQEHLVPLLFLLFSPLFSGVVSIVFFKKGLRARTMDAEELAEELKALYASKTASGRAPEVEGEGSEWAGANSPDARKKALRAVLLLGESNYRETLALLQTQGKQG